MILWRCLADGAKAAADPARAETARTDDVENFMLSLKIIGTPIEIIIIIISTRPRCLYGCMRWVCLLPTYDPKQQKELFSSSTLEVTASAGGGRTEVEGGGES